MSAGMQGFLRSCPVTLCLFPVPSRMGVALHQPGHGHSHQGPSAGHSTSVRAAFVHVVGDLLQSIGVLVAAYVIYFKVRATLPALEKHQLGWTCCCASCGPCVPSLRALCVIWPRLSWCSNALPLFVYFGYMQ